MMLSIFMVLFTTIISTVDSACDNCNRCVDDKCMSNCWCEKACKSGYYGNICAHECPIECVSCGRQYALKGDSTYHVCFKCNDGDHNGSSTNCSCPPKCQQCTSTTTCNKCNIGWYGGVCTSPCPQDCRDNVCSKTDGSCTNGCVNGKFGTKCQIQCPTTCKNDVCHQTAGTCTNGCIANFAPGADSKCDECIPGQYSKNCESDCLSTTCLKNKCDQGNGTCTNGCMSNFDLGDNSLCDVCIPGKYGLNCAAFCSTTHCLDNECDRENGTCSKGCTSPNLIGSYCNACINGMYGDNCQLTCPNNCKDNVCERYPGTCKNGCKTVKFTGNKCNDCTGGYYGEHCNTVCPVNCKYNTCTKETGECFGGCKGNFTGLICDACKAGYYGNNCGLICPSTSCNDNGCDRETGQCENCSTGVFGSFCDQTCSVGCISNECDQLNGNCKNGCKNGYSGNKCCNSKGYCEQCRNTTHCTQCITGFFGDNCIKSCPENCANGCSMENGQCTSCNRGYFGPECNNNCSRNCFEGICDHDAGKCSKCISGYHGDNCDKTCSNNCVNNACSQDVGNCIDGCSDGFQGQDCSESLSLVEPPVSTIAGPVAGGVTGFLVVIAIAVVGLIFFRRRKRRADHPQSEPKECPRVCNSSTTPALGENNERASYENERDTHYEHEEIEESVDDDNEENEEGYDVDPEYINIAESNTEINVSDLYKFVSKADNGYFKKEFDQLSRVTLHACTFARKPENKSLNRFKGIYPYDHSRVQLKDDPNFFINACYIDGYKTDKAYIASVGPTADITNRFISFWKMVWYEKADIIVMLTNLNEASGMKCEQYWPGDGQTCVYGDITVTYQGVNAYAEYSLTRMTIAKGKQQRYLTHVQYTSWPDKSVPDNVVSLVELRQRVKAIKTVTGGPTIVHCSAGVGRTGTYIALDILTDQGKAEHTVNVFDCVMKLREQRVNMVQTHEQYEYLYRGIVYTLTFGSDPFTVNSLQTDVAKLNDKWYAKQFQLLENKIETEPWDEEEAREVNKLQGTKNRQGADIPGNKARPRLFLNRAFNEPDFINAIYINSFKKMNRFIAAQTPLPASLSDFLCLIYQNKCSCIIDMNDTVSYDKHQVGMYLPDVNQTVEVDSYTVSCSDREMKSTYIKSILLVNNSSKQRPGQMVVEHYQYTGWRYDGEVPDNVGQFVQFVNTVQIAADSQTEDLSPMLIHCLNAFERSGLFCTLAVLLEKLECEQQVSIGNAIRQIRLRRYKAIPNKAQYKFCHECAAAYTDMFSTYSNFAV